MKRSSTKLLGRFSRNTKGSIYLELIASMFIFMVIFIGCASVGMKLVDFDRDSRAAASAADMTWVLDKDNSSPDQSDFDIIGQAMLEVTGLDVSEEFQIYFTAVEYDHVSSSLRVDWQGSHGTDPSLQSRVHLNAGLVTVSGYDLSLRDDERVIIVELYRSRRGLFVDNSKPVYTYAISYRHDPVHA